MSGLFGAVSNASAMLSISGQSFGPMSPVIENAMATAQRLNLLTEQSSSGLISQTYSGLGAAAAATVLTVSPQISSANAQISEINAVIGPMSVQQNAITSISSIVSGMTSQLVSLNTLNSNASGIVIADAQSALQQVAGLLNTQDGNNYLFAGQDSGEAPIPDPSGIFSSGFYTQIQSAVASLSGSGTTATMSAILGIASSNAAGTSPFSPGLNASPGLPSLSFSGGEQVTTGISANSNAFVSSPGAGATSTGSYMRDILAGLASIASLSPSQLGGTNFSSFISGISTMLQNANATLNQDSGVLGNIQSELNSRSTNLQNTVTALTNQVANADSIDPASVLSQISSVQTALQSSYQIIASMKTLNLAYYL